MDNLFFHVRQRIGGLVLILLFVFCGYARAYDFAVRSRGEVLYYNILSQSERTVELTHGDLGMEYENRSYTIPRCVRHKGKRYRVVAVGKRAFARCNNLTSITLNSHITRIDSAAFTGCLSLWKVKFPPKLSYIGDRAFYGCETLTYVHIPQGVAHIGTAAFSGCPAVVDITVSDKNSRYSDADGGSCIMERQTGVLLQGCANTVMPDNTKAIGSLAFSGCTELTDLRLPPQIERIGESAFAGCTSIRSVSVKAYTPPHVEENAFPPSLFGKARLNVPPETISLYIEAAVWKDFRQLF